jgi:hypothetical protein
VFPVRRLLLILPAALAAAGCGTSSSDETAPPARTTPAAGAATVMARARPRPQPVRLPVLASRAVRAPDIEGVRMDENPANLASSVVTFAFGKLPEYIDRGEYRLLPFDMFRAATPGETTHRTHRLTLPRTGMILDTAVTEAQTVSEVRAAAALYRIDVALDGRWVQHPLRHWVFYRNNGAQMCRIYFPDDLSSLQMAANSMVFRRLTAGRHRLHVVVDQTIVVGTPPARFVTDYDLRVLPRGPGKREAAIAPDESAPPPADRTPLAYTKAAPLRH